MPARASGFIKLWLALFARAQSMSILVSEVYEALVEAGASQEKAKAAAAAIPIGADLATKQDILELRAATQQDIAKQGAAIAELRKDIEFLKLVVFRFLAPAQLPIVGLAVKAAFSPG